MKPCPPIGMNCQSYELGCKVSLSTPKVSLSRTSAFGSIGPSPEKSRPPVPTMNCCTPLAASTFWLGVDGAKRS